MHSLQRDEEAHTLLHCLTSERTALRVSALARFMYCHVACRLLVTLPPPCWHAPPAWAMADLHRCLELSSAG